MKKTCPKCGLEISAQNYSRHIARCDGSGLRVYIPVTRLSDSLNCKFCGKLCKNFNSLRQHECRCPENPDRCDYEKLSLYITANRKGKNAENCLEIAKQRDTLKHKYEDGYVSKLRGRKINFDYIYSDHNNSEISKWLNYLKASNIKQPDHSYETYNHHWGYLAIKKDNKKTVLLEHIYIADILLDNKLKNTNAVHHINRNKLDNSIYNLMVFQTVDDHKRFHNSKYAYLSYDESTHLFTCELKDM